MVVAHNEAGSTAVHGGGSEASGPFADGLFGLILGSLVILNAGNHIANDAPLGALHGRNPTAFIARITKSQSLFFASAARSLACRMSLLVQPASRRMCRRSGG